MYIQRVPHPLAHFSRDPYSKTIPEVFQSTPTDGTALSGVSQPRSHRTGYIALAVVLAVLFLGLVVFFIRRRRVGSLLPCTRRDEKQEFPPRMQREARLQVTDGFNIIPSWNAREESASSRTPTSPSSEGPATPFDCEDRGDLGIHIVPKARDECPFVPIPIIVHTPTQTHQTTFLTGPDTPDAPELGTPAAAQHELFFGEQLPNAAHGSVIRPHGLPLAPVPEESCAVVSFPSRYFEVDEETLYGIKAEGHRYR